MDTKTAMQVHTKKHSRRRYNSHGHGRNAHVTTKTRDSFETNAIKGTKYQPETFLTENFLVAPRSHGRLRLWVMNLCTKFLLSWGSDHLAEIFGRGHRLKKPLNVCRIAVPETSCLG